VNSWDFNETSQDSEAVGVFLGAVVGVGRGTSNALRERSRFLVEGGIWCWT